MTTAAVSEPPADPSAPLTVRTIRVPDPGPLLSLLPDDAALAWTRREQGLVGWGTAARIAVRGPDRFAHAAAWWDELRSAAVIRDEVGLPGSGLVTFGSFTFDDGPSESVLVVPEMLVGRRGDTWWLTTVGTRDALPPLPALPEVMPLRPPPGVSFADGARPESDWLATVTEAVARIGGGELDKVVLARDCAARADGPVDLRWPLRRLAESYPACWTFCIDGLVGATPEMLVRLEQGLATSRVLAGTIRRTGDDSGDLALAASLARSSKDLEEHEYAVRSVADALAAHCTALNVPENPFVLHLPNVMHLATDVTGVLADDSTSLGLAAALHPSAAVCGTPTEAARRLIRLLEGMDRGRYAGPVGWMDAAGDGEWALALRCARREPADATRLRLFAGCGIVAGSDPAAEFAESAAKLQPMRDALTR